MDINLLLLRLSIGWLTILVGSIAYILLAK
jgi:hypothetical protein